MKASFAIGSIVSCALLAATSSVAFAQSKKVEASDVPAIYAFNVVLVMGEMQGASSPDNLPLGATKALADVRDFLPYKNYRLLDTQFIRCCASMHPGSVIGSLRGVDDQQYAFLINPAYVGGRLAINFSLRDSVKSTSNTKSLEAREVSDLPEKTRKDIEQTRKELAESRKNLTDRHPSVVELESRLAELLRQKAEQPPVGTSQPIKGSGVSIQSAFSMDVGETVVIGTSSLKGDKALIALLTAVRRPEATQGEKK